MQTIHLDISSKGVAPTIYAKQGDVGRQFAVVISDGSVLYNIPENASVTVFYQTLKNDNAGSFESVVFDGSRIVVTMSQEITGTHGDGILCLTISHENGEEISTWNIPYNIEIKPGVQPITPTPPSWNKSAVLYTEQNLTDKQKEQARKNIGAAAVGEGGGSISATDDGNGNVEITMTGGFSVTDDGEGNVTIT